MTNLIENLAVYFAKLPGIGQRQSRRFVYFLLKQDKTFLDTLAKYILDLKKEIDVCKDCQRFFISKEAKSEVCSICGDAGRDKSSIMIVEKDIDLENIERSDSYKGKYFVLGGTVPILDKKPESKIRSKEMAEVVKKNKTIKEVIIATSANPEGENTADYVKAILKPLQKNHKFKISLLGRGLSTGTELEYSDPDTIKSALENRG